MSIGFWLSSGSAAGQQSVVEAAQLTSVFTGRLGVTQPAGLAYVRERGILLVARRGKNRTRLLQISALRVPAGTSSLPKLSHPSTLAFDSEGGGLVAVGRRELIRIRPSGLGLRRPEVVTRDLRSLRLRDPQGAAFDTTTRRWLVLDSGARSLVAVAGVNGAPTRPARVSLARLGSRTLRGLAFNPTDRLLYTAAVDRGLVYALDLRGRLRKTYSIRNASMQRLSGLAFGRSSNPQDAPSVQSLYVSDSGSASMLGRIVEFSLTPSKTNTSSVVAFLGVTIDTGKLSPPSPDPSGIVYLAGEDSLLIADSEVEELPSFKGANLFKVKRNGMLVGTGNTLSVSSEPTGLALHPATSALYVSDDNRRTVSRHLAGTDGQWGTPGGSASSFRTVPLGSRDPEDVAFDPRTGRLYICEGRVAKIVEVDPINGVFGDGDDRVVELDLTRFGIEDAEGLGYDPQGDTLVVADRTEPRLIEITKDGKLVRDISLAAIAAHISPADVTVAPSAGRGGRAWSYWVVDRGVDSRRNPGQNDGRIYEVRLP